ncbi:hypothetical protein ACHAWF_010551 [Thalassiosira exigua]
MTTLRVAAAAGSALALAASAVAGAASEQPGRRPRATLPAAAVEDLMKTVRRTGPEGANDGGGSDGASSSTRPRRRLDEFEVDGSYSLKFSQCVDLKLMDEDLFDDEFVSYTKAGQIVSTKSYVLFHVCQDNDCYYESEDDLYLVDLSTYAGNVASAFAASRNAYCDSCDTYYYDTCVAAQGDDGANDDAANDDGGDDAVAYDDAGGYYAANDDDGGGQRRRDRGLATTYIDCDTCQAYGCLDDGDDNNGNNQNQNQNGDDDPVLEFIEGVAECFNTGVKWNDEELYVGFMCSPYSGDGVELAVFLDNECTVYTTLKAFGDMPSWYLYDSDSTFEAAETHIKSAFTETLPCQYETFGDPANQNGDDAYNYNNDDNNGNEATEYCQNIFEDGGAIAFNSCLNNNQNNNNNNENDDNYKWVSPIPLPILCSARSYHCCIFSHEMPSVSNPSTITT